MSKGALSRFPRLTLAGALTNAVLRRSDRCLKHYYSVRPGAGCDSFVRDAIALLGVRGADRLPPRMLWDLEKLS